MTDHEERAAFEKALDVYLHLESLQPRSMEESARLNDKCKAARSEVMRLYDLRGRQAEQAGPMPVEALREALRAVLGGTDASQTP